MTHCTPDDLPPRDYPAWKRQPYVGVRAIVFRPNPAPCPMPPPKGRPKHPVRGYATVNEAEDVGD